MVNISFFTRVCLYRLDLKLDANRLNTYTYDRGVHEHNSSIYEIAFYDCKVDSVNEATFSCLILKTRKTDNIPKGI